MHERLLAPVAPSARFAWVVMCTCSLVHLAGGGVVARAADAAAETAAPLTSPPPTVADRPPTPAPPLAPPMTAAAQAHYDRGLNLYRQHQYQAAAAELRRGFLLEPRREFLFAEAQAWRLAGDCGRALPLYQQFVDSQPPPLQVEAARLGIDRCAAQRAAAGENSLRAAPAAPPRASAPPPWWRDAWWVAAAGAGTVALGAGVGYLVASDRARDEALSSRTTTYARFDERWHTAQQRRAIGLTALVGGALLAVAGGARLLVLHRRAAGESHEHDEANDVTAPDTGGTAIRPPAGPASALSLELGVAGPMLTWEGGF